MPILGKRDVDALTELVMQPSIRLPGRGSTTDASVYALLRNETIEKAAREKAAEEAAAAEEIEEDGGAPTPGEEEAAAVRSEQEARGGGTAEEDDAEEGGRRGVGCPSVMNGSIRVLAKASTLLAIASTSATPPEGRMQRGGTLGTEAQETRDYINSQPRTNQYPLGNRLLDDWSSGHVPRSISDKRR